MSFDRSSSLFGCLLVSRECSFTLLATALEVSLICTVLHGLEKECPIVLNYEPDNGDLILLFDYIFSKKYTEKSVACLKHCAGEWTLILTMLCMLRQFTLLGYYFVRHIFLSLTSCACAFDD